MPILVFKSPTMSFCSNPNLSKGIPRRQNKLNDSNKNNKIHILCNQHTKNLMFSKQMMHHKTNGQLYYSRKMKIVSAHIMLGFFMCQLINGLDKTLDPLSCIFLFILEWAVVVSPEELKKRQRRNSEDTDRPDQSDMKSLSVNRLNIKISKTEA